MRKAHCGILKFMTAMDATIPPDLDRALDFIREFLYNSHTQAHQCELIRVRQRELIYELACRNLTMKLDLIQKASNLPPREADFYYQQIDELSKLLDSILQEAEHEMMRISHQEGRRARQNLRDGAGELDAPALAHSNASAVPLSASTADLLARTTLPGLDDDDAREVRRILEDPEYAELVTARHRALVSASALARSLSTREVADMTGRSHPVRGAEPVRLPPRTEPALPHLAVRRRRPSAAGTGHGGSGPARGPDADDRRGADDLH